jgi:hypothetical protein
LFTTTNAASRLAQALAMRRKLRRFRKAHAVLFCPDSGCVDISKPTIIGSTTKPLPQFSVYPLTFLSSSNGRLSLASARSASSAY